MTRRLEIALLLGLMLPGAVYAQRAAGSAAPGAAPVAAAPVDGIVRGSIEVMNVVNGIVSVRTGANLVTLEGTPSQLAGLDPGDIVQFPYVTYDRSLWLAPQVGGAYALFGPTTRGRITGPVGTVARGAGEIVVRGTSFRIHPARLQGISTGMTVDATYTQIGSTSWITTIAPVDAPTAAPRP